jgi:D-alanine-D-alanine ligase
VFGGQSAEHEISILSARNVLEALDRSRFEPVLIGIDKGGRWLVQEEKKLLASSRDPRQVRISSGVPMQLAGPLVSHREASVAAEASRPRIDVIFPVMHGTLGEDGAMQGVFEVAGVPYVGAGVLGSAIGMDKDVMKRLLRDAGIAVADFRTLRRAQFDANPESVCASLAPLGLPLFTKPANAGSSVGVRKVSTSEALPEALKHAFEFDTKVLAESAIVGREIELAVLGGRPPSVSGAGEVIVQHADGFYSYEAKYIDEKGAVTEIPARMTADELERAQRLAVRAFEALECEGMARVDLFLQQDGQLLINEINTLPGFTAISMYPKLWAAAGITPTDLVTRLIDLALQRSEEKARLRRTAL